MTNETSGSTPTPADELMRIVADVGAVSNGAGLVPGSGALRIEMRPMQLVQLARFIPARAMEALGLALEYGVLRLDPFRIEVVGWGRDWLTEHGMRPAAARAAIRELTEAGITVTTLGPKGPRGERLGIIGAAHCGWDVGDVIPIRDGRPTGSVNTFKPPVSTSRSRLAKKSPGEKLTTRTSENPQVRMVGQDVTNLDQPVDNSVGEDVTNRESDDPTVPAHGGENVQVRKVGEIPARQELDPTTSSSVSDQKELSGRGVLASSSLTLADVHHLMSSPDLWDAANTAGDLLLVHLADVFSRADRDKVAAVVDFHGYRSSDAPHMVFAALVTQVVQTDPDGRDELVEDLFTRCRAGQANLPRPPALEFLAAWLLTMTAAMSATPTKWGAWVHSGIHRAEWATSPVMRDVIACLAHLAEHGSLVGVPMPVTGQDATPGGAGTGGAGTGESSPKQCVRVDPDTGEWPAEVMEELRSAVAGTAFADELTLQTLLGNPAWVNKTLSRWRQRATTGTPVAVTDTPPDTGVEGPVVESAESPVGGSPVGEDPAGALSDEERLTAHAELLAEIVVGTKWAQQEEWERLLANPTLQSRLLHRHKVNQILITQGGSALSMDSIT